MQGAVFVDRDGTVVEEFGYANHIDRFCLFPWSGPAIRKLNEAGLPVFVITNQSGVAMGYFPEQLVSEFHSRLTRELALSGARLDGVYYCPHHPGAAIPAYRLDCNCRKPRIGMLQSAAGEHGIDLSRSYVVGDRYRDVETGLRAGAQSVLVLSGYGKGEYLYHANSWTRKPDHVAGDLAAAADWILQREAKFTAGAVTP